jgi:hypothetical protein
LNVEEALAIGGGFFMVVDRFWRRPRARPTTSSNTDKRGLARMNADEEISVSIRVAAQRHPRLSVSRLEAGRKGRLHQG